MLPQTDRLRRNRVEYILKKGQRQANQYFSIKFLRGAESDSRFAVVVSMKVEPKAVDRNQLRRRIYEAIKKAPKPKDPLDMVLITRPSTKKLSFQELQKAVNQTLSQFT